MMQGGLRRPAMLAAHRSAHHSQAQSIRSASIMRTHEHVLRVPSPSIGSLVEKDILSPLPPSFLGLYRLFLRTVAASVLSQPEATSSLRKQSRPFFSQAASVIRQLQEDHKDLPSVQREALAKWLTEWERRADNTLSLLYSSAIARGMPHQVTRNLHMMSVKNMMVLEPPPFTLEGGVWDGQLPADHPRYQPAKTRSRKLKTVQHREKDRLSDGCLRALSDLVGMAEGWGGISVGRLQRKR